MATQINRIPTPSVTLVDPQTGIIDQYWYDYLAALAGGQPLKNFANDAAAAAGGVAINVFYRNGRVVQIRVT
jgi:heme oxygenase